MLCLIMYKVRSENGYGFLRPGLKTGVGIGILWSEIGSGFGDASGTPPPKNPRSTPAGFIQLTNFREPIDGFNCHALRTIQWMKSRNIGKNER